MERARIRCPCRSLSSIRGTWIEIATRAFSSAISRRRPPHGGRGLKFFMKAEEALARPSSSTQGTWIEMTEMYQDL